MRMLLAVPAAGHGERVRQSERVSQPERLLQSTSAGRLVRITRHESTMSSSEL